MNLVSGSRRDARKSGKIVKNDGLAKTPVFRNQPENFGSSRILDLLPPAYGTFFSPQADFLLVLTVKIIF
jgi:hypothetical protein